MTVLQERRQTPGRRIRALLLALLAPACAIAGPPGPNASNGPIGSIEATPRGRDVFVQTCAACHVMGTANAPRIGEKKEWQERLTAGRPSLLRSVLKGKGTMPPKGGNASLTDDDAGAALDYLISRIGQ